MDSFNAKRLRFVAAQLDQHDQNGTTPPAELEMEFATLSQLIQQIPRPEPRKVRQREKEQEATKFFQRRRA